MLVSNNKFILPFKFSVIVCAILLFSSGCRQNAQINPVIRQDVPNKFLWAWERPEDLRFLDSSKFGVAFLAQTLIIKNDEVILNSRRQSLQIAPETYLIAVTRIETDKQNSNRPIFSDEQKEKVVFLIKNTLELPNVKGIQIDFDATQSERSFYRAFINDLKKQLPENTPLTMTALASWCVGDAWFSDFPIDEAIPMAFEMGTDDKQIRDFLIKDNDWNESLCRGSYGVAVDEPLKINYRPNRKIFYFKSKSWEKSDLEKLN